MNRSRLAFALGLLAPALLLGGCSDDPVPKVAPASESASASESPSPSGSAEPTMPAVAKGSDAAGARAFVKFWFVAFSYAMRTGDTELVRSLSTPGCVSCHALIERVDGIYSKGGSIKSRGWTVEVAAPARADEGSAAAFLLRVRQERRTLYGSDHKVVDSTDMAKVPMRAQLVSAQGSWSLKSLEIVG